jgi:hypothetical protein
MNVEQWGEERGNETVEAIVNHPGDDAHSEESLLREHGDAGMAIREAFGVDPEDKQVMLAKFRELSRNADSVGLTQLHNLYRKWEETEGKKKESDGE